MADIVPGMVERVARAIATAREQNGGPPFDAYGLKYARPALFDEATAAISAMGGAAAEIERLSAALRSCPCPGGGWNGMPEGLEPTVGACVDHGTCGCVYGAAVSEQKGSQG